MTHFGSNGWRKRHLPRRTAVQFAESVQRKQFYGGTTKGARTTMTTILAPINSGSEKLRRQTYALNHRGPVSMAILAREADVSVSHLDNWCNSRLETLPPETLNRIAQFFGMGRYDVETDTLVGKAPPSFPLNTPHVGKVRVSVENYDPVRWPNTVPIGPDGRLVDVKVKPTAVKKADFDNIFD